MQLFLLSLLLVNTKTCLQVTELIFSSNYVIHKAGDIKHAVPFSQLLHNFSP